MRTGFISGVCEHVRVEREERVWRITWQRGKNSLYGFIKLYLREECYKYGGSDGGNVYHFKPYFWMTI